MKVVNKFTGGTVIAIVAVTNFPCLPANKLEFPMSLEALHNLFLDELKDVYDAEKQLIKALPKMAKATSSPAHTNRVSGPLGGNQKSSGTTSSGS